MIKNLTSTIAAVAAFLSIVLIVLLVLGYHPFVLSTQSMEPTVMKGSLCWVDTKITPQEVEVGDIVVYRSPANSLVLHRLVDMEEGKYVLKGDASQKKQEVALSKINFIGREVFSIPGLGSFVGQSRWVFLFAVVFLVLGCVPWDSIQRKAHR